MDDLGIYTGLPNTTSAYENVLFHAGIKLLNSSHNPLSQYLQP